MKMKFEQSIDELIELVQYAKNQHEQAIHLNNVLQTMIVTAGGHLWMKDADGKYQYCDPTWCEVFFKMPSGCNIIGYTDKELLDEFKKCNKRHTYGNVCYGTDQHCIESGKQCHFIELGYIEDELFVLDVIKTPLIEDGKITGTVGFARNLSHNAEWVCEELKASLKNGDAKTIFKLNNDVAAYLITRNNDQHKAANCLKSFPTEKTV